MKLKSRHSEDSGWRGSLGGQLGGWLWGRLVTHRQLVRPRQE